MFPNWSYITNYDHNLLGRIWVVWCPEVRLTPCFTSKQMITCSVLLEGKTEEIFCSFVYASNSVDGRRELWENIRNHQDSPLFSYKPWIVFGDFNEILDREEHSGHDSMNTALPGMTDFQVTTQYCSMLDMSYQGPRFTWCNKRDNGVICKKLDRTLMNDIWMNSFLQSYCVFEAGGCSDHLRCNIMVDTELVRPRKPFKFTNAVAGLQEFVPIVDDYWNSTEPIFKSTSALFRFSKKLKNFEATN